MAGLDDLATIQKNGVVAVNALVQALAEFKTVYERVAGLSSRISIDENTVVFTGAGRIGSVSVTTAIAGGTIHDSESVAEADGTNVIYSIPNAEGISIVNFPIVNGLVVKPASGSVVSISYSEAT